MSLEWDRKPPPPPPAADTRRARLAELARLLEAATAIAADFPPAVPILAQLHDLIDEVTFLAALIAADPAAFGAWPNAR